MPIMLCHPTQLVIGAWFARRYASRSAVPMPVAMARLLPAGEPIAQRQMAA